MKKINLQCIACRISFDRFLSWNKKSSKSSKRNNRSFCSKACYEISRNKKQNVICLQCKTEFIKTHAEVIRSPNNFCSKSCAATYNNTHKTKGTRVAKLEIYLKEQLTQLYPKLEIHYNRKDAINSELDIFIPSLRLAVELNGIFHYEPIYGEEKLKQIQNNDTRKFQACLERGIELVIIDSSKLSYFKPDKAKKYLDMIVNIINIKLNPR